jgi:hypothetical protein
VLRSLISIGLLKLEGAHSYLSRT